MKWNCRLGRSRLGSERTNPPASATRANAREHQKLRRIDRTATEDDFATILKVQRPTIQLDAGGAATKKKHLLYLRAGDE
jgi:hypothetical protein